MDAVKKPSKVRLCIGPKDLNPAIKRPDFQMPTVNDILPKISKTKLLTVVDAKEDFWHLSVNNFYLVIVFPLNLAEPNKASTKIKLQREQYNDSRMERCSLAYQIQP